MAFREHTAPRRAVFTRANFKPVIALLVKAHRWACRPNPPHIRDISPHLARDAGLDQADLAVHQHHLPSQHLHHPRS